MSKKVLILGMVAVLVVGGVATYVWIDYSQAQVVQRRSRRSASWAKTWTERNVNLDELYRVASIRVEQLERSQSMWISKSEIASLRTTLADEKHELDQRAAAAAAKRKPPPDYGGWSTGDAKSDQN